MVATTIIPNKKIVAKANIEPKTVITKPNLPEHDYINYNSVNKEALGMNSEANAMIEQLRIDKDKVDAALNEGKSIVDQRHNEVDQINQRHFFESADHQYSPTFAHYHMAKPKREALRVRNKAEILLETTKIIMREKRDIFVNGTVDKKRFFEVATKEDVAKIISTTQHRAFTGERVNLGSPCIPKWYPCNINSKFRTITGWCNNIKRPHYGMAFGAMVRLLPPQYENGIDQPRIKAINGMNLYSPRIVSNIINEGHPPTDNDGFSHVASLFGQFIAHDITHAPIETNKTGGILVCSKCDSHQKVSPNCLPIEIPLDDPYYPPFVKGSERRCLPYTRSLLGDASKGYREQMVQVTPYIDLSALYGSTDCEAKELRSMVDGQMKHCEIKGANSECLPKIDKPTSCRSFPKYPCFLTGDVRSSDTSALSGLHNIFLREHNKISAQFKKINPHWNDERIYQETRRLLGALFQHMVYNEYVPLLIGPNLMHQHITYPKKAGYFEGYNYTCDGMISQAFQTSAFRFGHSLILNEFARLNGNFEKMTPNLRLVDLFNNAESMYNKKCSGFEGIILGTVGQASNKLDRFYTDDLRNRLFEVKEKNMYGFDLLSINIQRGRDHALPGYNDFRQYCGFSKLRNWKDLKNEMEPVVIKKLRRIYNNVDDIDLYVGLITEKHNYTTHLLPKTSACIVADQFARLKKCDRYFYENNVKGSLFTQKQLNQIRKYTFNRLLCDNIKMLKMIQRNPFRLHNLKTNPYIPCSQLLSVDLRQWKEKPPVKKSQTNP
uniref:Peroxidasin n=1 Tax=Rhabditophanes sp. KR3021 TaxID=114890 RepID=A0AC35U402_9BILA